MRRCFVGEAHDMLSTFDDVFRTLALVRWWILLSVYDTWKDGHQEKKQHRAHDLKPFLLLEGWGAANNSGICSWRHALEQLCDLPWFCPPQPLVPLPRQSIHFGAQGNQILDLLVEVVDLRTQQAADMTAGCAAPVTHGQNGLQFGERKTNRQSPLNQFHPKLRCRRILPIISGRALRQRQKSKTLLMPQRIGAYAREMC